MTRGTARCEGGMGHTLNNIHGQTETVPLLGALALSLSQADTVTEPSVSPLSPLPLVLIPRAESGPQVLHYGTTRPGVRPCGTSSQPPAVTDSSPAPRNTLQIKTVGTARTNPQVHSSRPRSSRWCCFDKCLPSKKGGSVPGVLDSAALNQCL